MPTYQTENMQDIKLFSGRSNPRLAEGIAHYLGISPGAMVIKNFSDGELYVRIQDSIRGENIFIVQSLCNPVNDNLMELLIMVDAFKRASAKSITVVVPYYGYARQDRKASGREAITAKLVADLLTTAGVTRVLAMDLHAGQIQGFFNILVDHIHATALLAGHIEKLKINPADLVIVSPDTGGVSRARHLAKRLGCTIAIIDKRRDKHNEAIAAYAIGDVKGKVCVLFDDIIDTAGTICEAARLLVEEGAKEIYVCAVHPVFSGKALERLAAAPIKECIVTNTIPLDTAALPPNIKQLSVAPLLAQAIALIQSNGSVSALFGEER